MQDYRYSYEQDLITMSGIGVTYGNNVVLRDVNHTIRNIVRPGHTQGQVEAFLAPSGMGKSQLFRRISGLPFPLSAVLSGTVTLVDGSSTVPGAVGVVSQSYPLVTHLTVGDNMMLAAKQKHGAGSKDAVMMYLERFGLVDKYDAYPKALSGGQRQRIAIGQQMLCARKVLLMDEPFSGLDIGMKTEVQKMITDWAAEDEDHTVVLTTHDIPSAVAISDTISLLGREHDPEGKIIPGATFVKHYNLMDMGLTWRPDIHTFPAFHRLVDEIHETFSHL